jgi:hypothetical protein
MVSAIVWSQELRAFHLALTGEGLKPRTIVNYAKAVERFGRQVGKPIAGVTPADLHAYRDPLSGYLLASAYSCPFS